MKLRTLIRQIIIEAEGDGQQFETGTLTPQANELILFAENVYAFQEFALNHTDDKIAIFKMALARYEREHGRLGGDEETVMYDFLAHYDLPESEGLERAKAVFGNRIGKEVTYIMDVEGGFLFRVKPGFGQEAQALVQKAGGTVMSEPHATGTPDVQFRVKFP